VKYWSAVVAIAVALFFAGYRASGVRAERATARGASSPTSASNPASPPPRPGSPAAARRAAIEVLLSRLARAPRETTSPPTALPIAAIERSTVEPTEDTVKRRARVSAEIDQKAPGLSAATRTILLAEADRLAWDKRQFRAAFLSGQMSEAEYVDALKDDIRATLANYDDVLSNDDYVALFNRPRGKDPFTLESYVDHGPDKHEGSAVETTGSAR